MNAEQENAILREELKDIIKNLPLDVIKYKEKRDLMLNIILGSEKAKVNFTDCLTFSNSSFLFPPQRCIHLIDLASDLGEIQKSVDRALGGLDASLLATLLPSHASSSKTFAVRLQIFLKILF